MGTIFDDVISLLDNWKRLSDKTVNRNSIVDQEAYNDELTTAWEQLEIDRDKLLNRISRYYL